jgi:Fe-S-cluster containining protein
LPVNDPKPLAVRRLLTRDSPFSYRCAGCGRCCRDKLIQVNPYEVARLATRLGITTTEVLASCTQDGVWLRREPDGSCCLLRNGRCSVHGDQPLACRLYPLGRRVVAGGREELVELEPHPESEGSYGADGTAHDYLESQGIAEYVAASELYFTVLGRLAAALERRVARGVKLPDLDFGPPGGHYAHAGPLPAWLDMDAMVYSGLGSPDRGRPLTLWQKLEQHVAMLEGIAREVDEEHQS